ncbi:hypothetical protein ISS07_05690 [Candidatus Woesearchaeota archaeon]|nr:hypothetical protein [Candidatus Woesearchaeota archaeon]
MKFEIKKEVFSGTLTAVKENKKQFFYVFLLDVFFVLSLYVLGIILSGVASKTLTKNPTIIIFLILLYYALIILVHSFFKYWILDLVKSAYTKTKINLNKVGGFYLLNLSLFGILFVISLVAGLFTAGLREAVSPFISLFVFAFFLLFSYLYWNISQVLFFEGKTTKESLTISFSSLKNFKSYYGIFLVILVAVGIIASLFGVFGNILKSTLFQDYGSLLRYGDVYTILFVHSMGIIFYLAILFNRFYFYNIVRKSFLNKK